MLPYSMVRITFNRKFDDAEMASVAIDPRYSKKTIATLMEALLVPTLVYAKDSSEYGYFSIPKTLEDALKARYNKEEFKTLYGFEVRWVE